MKTKLFSTLLVTGAISLGAAPAIAESTEAPQFNFACQMSEGVPTTVAQNAEGETRAVFNWKEETLAYRTPSTPKELCDNVSRDLQEYSNNGYDLSQITFVGTEQAGLPTICATTAGNKCSKVLFTLTRDEQAANVANDVVTAILNPELQGKVVASYNDRGVQSTSYEVNFWDLFSFAPKGLFK
ncbi:hypothetical protein I4641_12015 [Waterburya agarophytonicola K14]|uniref:Uncharacterized protein n=1 Tax=Waterburya agarophytonicola KI4 TaxID=2874699 RepID=A0A964BQR0_9CYAN|nr:COP23 domain-containing protein [Waterburya agarophytonicola]MCC0177705.1 hypothetical protein [Waterburya agarophytonicola KI4]